MASSYKISGLLLITCALALAISQSLMTERLIDIHSDPNANRWDTYWKTGAESIDILPANDDLPTNIPGPLDTWAGGKSHSILLKTSLPAGKYSLSIFFHDIHETFPPLIRIINNDNVILEKRLGAGSGRPPPYQGVVNSETIELALYINSKSPALRIENVDGSWFAPARLTVNGKRYVSFPKLGLRLVSDPAFAAIITLLLLAGIFFFRVEKASIQIAIAEIAALLLSIVIGLALVEFGYRLWKINKTEFNVSGEDSANIEKGHNMSLLSMLAPTDDSEIPYRIKPGLDGYFINKRVRTNSFGFRGAEITLAKPPGTYRIVGLGDSVLFGWGVEERETTLNQLAKMIQENMEQTVEVIDTSAPGYNTAVEAAIYEKLARKFHPDIVVLMFVVNDFYYPEIMVEPIDLATISKSYLAEYLKRLLNSFAGEQSAGKIWVTAADFSEKENSFSSPSKNKLAQKIKKYYDTMIGKDAVIRYIKKIGAMALTDGATPVFVWPPFSLQPNNPDYDYPLPEEREEIEQIARKAGFLVPQLRDRFLKRLTAAGVSNQSELLWLDPERDSHPTADAHRMIAEGIFEALSSSNSSP